MKIFVVVLALVALALAQDNSAIVVDLGSIVGTTLNDPQACRRTETCLPLVGIAGEGLNLRRGNNIFNIAGIARTQTAPTVGLQNNAAITATTPDNMVLYQHSRQQQTGVTANTNRLPLAEVRIANAQVANSATTTPSLTLASLSNIYASTRAQSRFTPSNGVGASATGNHFTVGQWLNARATGLVRCAPATAAPYAFIELWFTNLVPQGLYSLHAVTRIVNNTPQNSDTTDFSTNVRTELLSGAGASYFTANYDGKAYVYRALPGSTFATACPFERTGADDEFVAIEARFHSNGMAFGAVTEVTSRYTPAATTNFFQTANTGSDPLLSYGFGSHSHVTISFPDGSKEPVVGPKLANPVSISSEFVV